jgi:hypothetical protein
MDENLKRILDEILVNVKSITKRNLKTDKAIANLVNDVKELKNVLIISPSLNVTSRNELPSTQASTTSESEAAVVPASVVEEIDNQQIEFSPSSPVEIVNNEEDVKDPALLLNPIKEEITNEPNVAGETNNEDKFDDRMIKQEEIIESTNVVEASHFPAISKSLASRIRFEKEPINFTFYPQIIELSSDGEETNADDEAQTEQNVNNSAASETFEANQGISNLQFLQKLIKSSQNEIPVVNVTRLANEQTISETNKAAEANKDPEQEVAGTSEQQTSTQETEQSTAQLETEINNQSEAAEILASKNKPQHSPEQEVPQDDQQSSQEINRSRRQRNAPKRCNIQSSSEDDEESAESSPEGTRKSQRVIVPPKRFTHIYALDLQEAGTSQGQERSQTQMPKKRNRKVSSEGDETSKSEEDEPRRKKNVKRRRTERQSSSDSDVSGTKKPFGLFFNSFQFPSLIICRQRVKATVKHHLKVQANQIRVI